MLLVYLATLGLTIVLGLVIFAQNTKEKRNVIYALMVLSTSIWIAAAMLADHSTNDGQALLWSKLSVLGPAFTPSLFVLFTFFYPSKKAISRTVKALLILPPVIIVPFINTEANVITAVREPWGTNVQGGWLYYLLFIIYLAYFGWGTIRLFKSYRTLRGVMRYQIRLVVVGILSTLIISIATNIILVILGDNGASQLGPPSTIFFTATTGYSILRHRFLDIRVLIGKIIYYSLLAVLPIGTFFLLVAIYTQLFGTVFHPTVYLLSVIVGIGFVMIFNKANEFLRTQVDSRLINPGYNPLVTAELLSNDLSLMIDLPKITDRMMLSLTKTIRPDYSAIVIFGDQDHPEDRIYASDGKDIGPQLQKLKQATITLWEGIGKHPVVQDEVDVEIEEGIYRNTKNIAAAVKQSMADIGGKVILTLGNKENIVGMIIVGQKEADSPYTTTDIDFLKSIANTGGLAIERSLLYEEVQQFANTLQEKVDKATAELKKTNGDLEKALAELQEARRVERDMIDVMGHELRTPISIVRNALVMLEHQQEKTDTVPKTELEKYLAMALESTRREITLIETLLSATKVDAARMQLYLERVDFKDVVNDGVEGQKAIAGKKGLSINYTLPEEEINVYADRTRIQEIMDNLLSNAVKYTLRGEVKVQIWQDDKHGWISITDSGIGISEQDLENLGKKFFRAKQYVPDNGVGDETKVVRPGGTGLGLYVTFDLIGVMGGQLYINSKVGEGSTFTFGIPLHTTQEPKQIDQTFDPQTRAQKPHVFIGEEAPTPTKGE